MKFNHRNGNRFKKINLKEHFTAIYRENIWGNTESLSGFGSSLDATSVVVEELSNFIKAKDVTSIVDAPCGDCNWISTYDFFNCDYIGIDIVDELIESNRSRFKSPRVSFINQDLTKNFTFPKVDLILMRDLLVHLSFDDANVVLKKVLNSKPKYFAVTSFDEVEENSDLAYPERSTEISWRPLNMSREPFNLIQPIHKINEKCRETDGKRIYSDKSLCIYEI